MSEIIHMHIPMMYFPIGGLYCSMTTVDTGNAFVLDLSRVRTATAIKANDEPVH